MSTSSLHTARELVEITPSDTVSLVEAVRAVYVGVGGNLSIVPLNGPAVTLTAVQGGSILPIGAARINATGTTASSLVGLL